MNFEGFKGALGQVRRYQTRDNFDDYQRLFLTEPHGASGTIQKISESGDSVLYDATHIVYPPKSGGVLPLMEEFAVVLPGDFQEFYRLWDGAALMLRETFKILGVSEMCDLVRRWRFKEEKVRLIRFAAYSSGDSRHFALRCKLDGSGWEVIFVDHVDAPLAEDEYTTHDADHMVTDSSFSDWLQRMTSTDGLPWLPGNQEVEESMCLTKRVN